MNDKEIKYIKKIAKENEEKIKQLTKILSILDNIRTGHVNTYDEENMDNHNYSMWCSEKNIYLMEELLKRDVNNHVLYLIVYMRLKNKGIFDNFESRIYNDEVLSIVYECTYDLIGLLDCSVLVVDLVFLFFLSWC